MLHVVTSCTDRKRVPVRVEARVRTVGARDLAERAEEWLDILTDSGLPEHAVRSLYGGEHWTEFQELLNAQRDVRRVSGWVISAGYGLLSIDGSVAAYSATFSPAHEDAVRPGGVAWSHRDWWEELGRHRIPRGADKRSILDLVQSDQDAQVVCAASYPYLAAVAADLLEAADLLGDKNRILVLGTRVPSSIRSHPFITTPDYDSRLQVLVGGSKIGLNIRVARRLLDSWRGQHVGVHGRSAVRRMMMAAPEPVLFDRLPASDEEVRSFIRHCLAESGDMAASPLLRKWRDRGRACEQSRFRRLYQEVAHH